MFTTYEILVLLSHNHNELGNQLHRALNTPVLAFSDLDKGSEHAARVQEERRAQLGLEVLGGWVRSKMSASDLALIEGLKFRLLDREDTFHIITRVDGYIVAFTDFAGSQDDGNDQFSSWGILF